jgi:hypothetical protein
MRSCTAHANSVAAIHCASRCGPGDSRTPPAVWALSRCPIRRSEGTRSMTKPPDRTASEGTSVRVRRRTRRWWPPLPPEQPRAFRARLRVPRSAHGARPWRASVLARSRSLPERSCTAPVAERRTRNGFAVCLLVVSHAFARWLIVAIVPGVWACNGSSRRMIVIVVEVTRRSPARQSHD